MYVQNVEQNGGHTDQKTTSTEYGYLKEGWDGGKEILC